MNLSTLIVKISSIPHQSFPSTKISLVTLEAELPRPKNVPSASFDVFIWGSQGNTLMKYYAPGDYIIVEGILSLKKKKIGTRWQKRVQFKVKEFYPFLLVEENQKKK